MELLGGAGVVDTETVATLAEEAEAAELAGEVIFIFRASSRGLEAAAELLLLLLLPGLGSRLITGMVELEVLGRGAARRLLRVVVVVVVEEVEEEAAAAWVEVMAGGETDFSGSAAGVSRTFWILLMPAFFSSSRSFTVTV